MLQKLTPIIFLLGRAHEIMRASAVDTCQISYISIRTGQPLPVFITISHALLNLERQAVKS